MNKLFKNTFLALSAAVMFTGCVHDDDYALPPITCNDRWEANADIPAIKALNDTDTPFEITSETVFDGYVVSSDETGNFFKTIVVQDALENPTAGMSIEVDLSNTYTRFPVGTRVLVDAQGLYVAKDRGTYKIGTTFDSNGTARVGRMPEDVALAKVAASCTPIGEVVPQTFSSIADALDESHVNTLIKLENVQFQNAGNGETYYDEDNAFGGATNIEVVDEQGNTVVLRTSSYADFAAEVLPDGSGSLTAVLSAYSGSNNVTPSSYQMFIRSIEDVQFDQPRFQTSTGQGPIGGGNATFQSCVVEDFESFSPDLVNFSNYINYAQNGDRYWAVKEFSGNKYLQLTAHNATTDIEAYFVVPVNFDDADAVSFKTKDGFNNGDVLTVYYSTSYQIGDNIDTSTYTDITSQFNIATGTATGYAQDYTESGEFDLSGISGNGAIIFKYAGSGSGVKTTMQIDDIMIVDNDNPDCGSDDGGDTPPPPPTGDAVDLFAGSDFENWDAFVGGLNSYGLKPYATQSTGAGFDGTSSLHIATDATTTDNNDYVFTALATQGLPASYTKISFYMKGSSSKSVSLNVYKADGTYYKFNLGSLTESSTLSAAASNQYGGTIDTAGEWVLISLDLTGISDINVTDTAEGLFALKIGKNADYDLHFDNFVIE